MNPKSFLYFAHIIVLDIKINALEFLEIDVVNWNVSIYNIVFELNIEFKSYP